MRIKDTLKIVMDTCAGQMVNIRIICCGAVEFPIMLDLIQGLAVYSNLFTLGNKLIAVNIPRSLPYFVLFAHDLMLNMK